MKLITKIAFLATVAASICTPCEAKTLTILHTNDTHSQIDPSKPDDMGGIARRKAAIDSVRAADEHVLLIDAGDVVQGSLFFNLYKGELEEKLMNALGYDMRILGNHEFDNGMEALADNLKDATAEMLCSNYDFRGTPLEGRFLPYSIKEIDGKRIAFMPINLQPAGMISSRNTVGMGYTDALATAEHLAWWLKNMEHADAIIAITHIGYNSAPDDDVNLAKLSEFVDVIIGGHSHTLINPAEPGSPSYLIKNSKGRDVVVAQTGRYGKYLGEIKIDLDSLQITPRYSLIALDKRFDDRIDPAIEDIIAPYRQAVDNLYSKNIAKTTRRLEKGSTDLLNFAADFVLARGKELADDVDFSIINIGGLRNDLPKGNVSEGDFISVMPFFNRVQVIDIKGADLVPAFDQMAKIGGNGVSDNVEATFDPATGKCVTINIDGKPIDMDKIYRLATIDYLADGGDYMTSLTRHKLVADSPNILFDDVISYYRDGKGRGKKINPSAKARMTPISTK